MTAVDEFGKLARRYLNAFPNQQAQIDLGNRMAMMLPALDDELAVAERRAAEKGWDEGHRETLNYERRLSKGEPDIPPVNPYRPDRIAQVSA